MMKLANAARSPGPTRSAIPSWWIWKRPWWYLHICDVPALTFGVAVALAILITLCHFYLSRRGAEYRPIAN